MEIMSTGRTVPGPEVGSAYSHGWKYLWRHFGILFIIGIIYVVMSMIFQVPQYLIQFPYRFGYSTAAIMTGSTALSIIGALWSIFVIQPVGYGQYYAYLRATRDDDVKVGDMFAAFRNYWNAVGASVLVGIFIAIGPAIAAVILVISAFAGSMDNHLYYAGIAFMVVFGVFAVFLACKLAFVPYIVVDRKMGAWTSIKESWRMTNGHGWRIFFLFLLGIPIAIAGLICLLVGVIIAAMWINMALASLYYAVSEEVTEPTV